MSAELNQLKDYLRRREPKSENQTVDIVFSYFQGVTWSLLKDEWDNKMSVDQRLALCHKLWSEIA